MVKSNLPSSVIADRKSRSSFTKLKFPADLGAHAMLLSFVDYSYGATQAGLLSSGDTAARTSNAIILPLPQNLEDIYGIRVNNRDLGITGAAALDVMRGLQNPIQAGKATADFMKNAVEELTKTDPTNYSFNELTSSSVSSFQAAARFFGRAGLDTIAPNVGAAADVATGTAINPHTTLDFDGVALKTHTFNWTLSPRSRAESETLNEIVKAIRFNILPNYKGISGAGSFSRALLNYPKLLHIRMLGVDEEYFMKFKPGMVQNFSVSYGDGEKLTLFAGGKPTTVRLTLTMLEAEIHTQEDYGGTSEDLIKAGGGKV